MCLTQRKAAASTGWRLLQQYRAGALACEKEGGAWSPYVSVYMVLIFHHLRNLGDLVVWTNQIPRLREDAGQCASLLHIICSGHNSSWAITHSMLACCWRSCSIHKSKIKQLKKHVELTYWQGEVGLSGLRWIQVGIVIIREIIPKMWLELVRRQVNWTKVEECRQRPE